MDLSRHEVGIFAQRPQPEPFIGVRFDDAGRGQTHPLLKGAHRLLGRGAELAVDRTGVETHLHEGALQRSHVRADVRRPNGPAPFPVAIKRRPGNSHRRAHRDDRE